MRPKSGGQLLPNLKTINKIPLDVVDLAERNKHKEALVVHDKLWKYCGTYRLVKPGVMDEEPIFYINDEVGSAINHSDDPNSRIAPFIWIPNCDGNYDQAKTFSIMWQTKNIEKEHYLNRDYL